MRDKEVGPERPIGRLMAGRYVGDDPALVGHTALISEAPYSGRSSQGVPRGPGWFVQDNDMESDYSHGWWWFTRQDWERR